MQCEPLAIYLNERGRKTHLAAELNISPAAVSQWAQVPSRRVIDVEKVTGIPRHVLRPDLYPQSEAA